MESSMCNVCGRREKLTEFLLKKPEIDYLKYLGIDERQIQKRIFRKQDGTPLNVFIWLGI
jgi:hypothetical protein